MYERARPGRDAAELTALADHLSAHGLTLRVRVTGEHSAWSGASFVGVDRAEVCTN
ncbi:hypothetical protein [Streptomyces sp. NBC_01174]|uniref:hypothetical protein n=1 Tax=Streptomyces sp. NBC_01174 TaxID=2903758 RepID=UPI003869A7AD|nr:hypothetical protein OG491_27305 [Streptomyces sp. NBC_01175]WSS81223.1 hypothetical protein OG414_27605 [Streptomyces sp. NBC_01174]